MLSIARWIDMLTHVLMSTLPSRPSCFVVASRPDSAMKRYGLPWRSSAVPFCTDAAFQNVRSAARACRFIRDCSYTFVTMMYQLPADITTRMPSVIRATRSPPFQSACSPYGFSITSVDGAALLAVALFAAGAGAGAAGGAAVVSAGAAAGAGVAGCACAKAAIGLTASGNASASAAARFARRFIFNMLSPCECWSTIFRNVRTMRIGCAAASRAARAEATAPRFPAWLAGAREPAANERRHEELAGMHPECILAPPERSRARKTRDCTQYGPEVHSRSRTAGSGALSPRSGASPRISALRRIRIAASGAAIQDAPVQCDRASGSESLNPKPHDRASNRSIRTIRRWSPT